ncbi:MAG: hypothetical protein ACR2N3_00520 [Pyrinomonadaceae bacterium]
MKILENATKIFGLILTLLFVNFVNGQTSDSIYTLPAGTRIYARMDNEINSKVSSMNDTFTVTVSKPVIIREVEVLPVGTILEGRIEKVRSAGFGKRDGSFEVKFETLRLANGTKRRIDAGLINVEKPKSSRTINAATIGGGTIIGALFGALADKSKGALIGAGAGLGIGTVVVLLQKGRESKIKSDEEIIIQLRHEVTLPTTDF